VYRFQFDKAPLNERKDTLFAKFKSPHVRIALTSMNSLDGKTEPNPMLFQAPKQ